MTTTDHNRLIKSAAKSLLRPLGCVQKGASRIWLDCHPLWVGVIEFQPHSWGKGSFLNVGACWLWYEKDYLSFDDGYRVEQFKSFENDEQFTEVALALATRARDEVLSLRARFFSLDMIAARLKENGYLNIWDNYHAAVAATLTNDLDHAAKRFSAVAAAPDAFPWAVELKERASTLASISDNSVRFLEEISQIIERSKALLKIP